MGLAAEGWPLSAAEPAGWILPAAGTFDALLLGSANALRHAGPGLAPCAGMPAYAVGAATAPGRSANGTVPLTSASV